MQFKRYSKMFPNFWVETYDVTTFKIDGIA